MPDEAEKTEAAGWVEEVWEYVQSLPGVDFELSELYRALPHFAKLHPNSHTIRSNIRCSLQKLRDRGEIAFLGSGHYRKTPNPDDPTADKLYTVTIEEILSCSCRVQAKTPEEALELVRRQYWEGKQRPEGGNMLNVQFRLEDTGK